MRHEAVSSLHVLVDGDEPLGLLRGAVTDDDLRRVLVRHDNGWCWEARSGCVRVVRTEFLLGVAAVLDRSRAVSLAGDGAKLTRAHRVLIGRRILPACLVKRVRDGACLALAILLLDDEGTA